jgi:hypothetical protein
MPSAQSSMLNDEAIPLSIGHSALCVTKVDEAALLTLASEAKSYSGRGSSKV